MKSSAVLGSIVSRRKRLDAVPRHPVHAGAAGLTLLELMFAAGIMASTLVFILGSIVSISTTSDIAGDQAAVAARISTVVEELRTSTTSELFSYVPEDPPAGSPDQTIQVEYYLNDGISTITAPFVSANLSSTMPELPNPLHVKITVSAISRSGRPFVVQTATMLRR